MKVRRFLAVDDCGTVINPMIVEGQIHGGLTEGFAIAFMQEIQYDKDGNNLNTNFTDYLVPTSLETPHWETANTVTPSPHHPIGAKGVGESPNVGSPAAFVNAVIDALSPLGVRHIDMPITRDKVWRAIRDAEGEGSRRAVNLQYTGEETIPVDKATVWAFINDPRRSGAACPTSSTSPCTTRRTSTPSSQVGVGPVRGKFKFKFELQPTRPATAWT